MNGKWALALAVAIGICGCAKMGGHHEKAAEKEPMAKAEAPEAGETKVKLEQTPAPVKAAIQRELIGADLEDISMKKRDGQVVYETDIIRDGKKWEVVVGENGSIVSKLQEGSAEEKAEDTKEEAAKAAGSGKADGYMEKFDVRKSDLAATGNNPCLPIQPGKVLKMRNAGGDTLTITILSETMTVDGVKCGVLEERETKNHKLEEVSRNFFATNPSNNDVYYFGEDVDNYKDGKIISHDSAWRAGEKGARFGLMISGKPQVGQKYYQEIAPKVALDRVEVVSTTETVKVPAGTFENCVHLLESTPLEPDVSHKWYAPGVGMIKDDDFELAEKP